MSVYVSKPTWEAAFPTPAFKLVALKLADCANDAGESIYPSVGRVARETGCSESTVRAVLADMQASGLLVVIEQSNGNRRYRSTTTRRIDLKMLAALGAGELRWKSVERDAMGPNGKVKTNRNGSPKRINVWRIAPPDIGGVQNVAPPDIGASPSGDRPQPLRTLAAAPPVTGPKPSREPSREPSNENSPPGPSRKTAPTPSQTLGEGDVLRLIDDLRTSDRARVVDGLLGPLVRRLKVDAPDPAFALAELADAADVRALDDAGLGNVLAEVTAARIVNFRPYDVQRAAKLEAANVRHRADMRAAFERQAVRSPELFETWRKVLARLRQMLGTEVFEAWIVKLEALRLDADGRLHLEASSKHISDWVRANYADHIVECCKGLLDITDPAQLVVARRAGRVDPAMIQREENLQISFGKDAAA